MVDGDLLEDVAEAIDWQAICEQFQKENEQLRFRIVQLRESRLVTVEYYWDALLDWLDDPRHQVWLLIAMPIVLTLLRGLFNLLQRRFRR